MKAKWGVRGRAACRAVVKEEPQRAQASTRPKAGDARRVFCVCAGTIVVTIGLSAIAVASPRTRSCGTTRAPGYPIDVRATSNVGCAPARRIMRVVYGEGSNVNIRRCYSAPGKFHACRVQGFWCTMRSSRNSDASSARCTKGRSELILGRT
jgi:hypothetical protein